MADDSIHRSVTDHSGSVRLVVNAETGAVVQRIDYDAFGRVLADNNPGFQPFGFAGGLYDDDTGLVRFGARDYDAYSGRWTAKDPVLFGGRSANIYEYVKNDPVNFIDPSGLWRGLFPGQGPEWHHNRNIFQEGWCPPTNPISDSCSPDWFVYSENQITHGGNVDIRGGGRLNRGVQCIYDHDGSLVTDPEFEGTYDFVPPQDDLWNHFIQDVIPWFVFGN